MNRTKRSYVSYLCITALLSPTVALAEMSASDYEAQQAALQNQRQLINQGAQGFTSAEGQQFINQGQAQSAGQTVQSMTQPQLNNTYQPPARTATGGGSAGTAKGAGIQQLITVGGGIAAAAVLKPPCSGPPPSPPNPAMCAMMALSLAQAAASLASSGQSKNSAGQFSTSSGPGGWETGSGTGVTNPYGTGGGSGGLGDNSNGGTGGTTGNGASGPGNLASNSEMGKLIGEYNALKSDLDKAGYRVSPDGSSVIGPDGKSIPSSAFSSPEAMKAAGFSDAQIEAMMNAQKAIAAKSGDKIRAIAMAVEGGGGAGMAVASGGGGAGGGRGGYGGYNFRAPGQRNANGKGVSGLSKQLGDDKIGLASDNIFEMVHIRYLERDKAGHFEK